MNDMDILEWTDMIDAEFIQESYELHSKEQTGRNIIKVKWWYYAGLAACLAVSILSGGFLVIGGGTGGADVNNTADLGTAANRNGSIWLGILILGLALAAAFVFLIVRAKRNKKQ